MKRTLTEKQVLARMAKGDLPTYAGSGTGAIFTDGARVGGSTIAAMLKGGEIDLPKHTSTSSPFTLAVHRSGRREEWRCHTCLRWIEADEVNWARADGSLSTMGGSPYCDGCLPRRVAERDAWVSGFVTSYLHECAQDQPHEFIGNLYEFARPQLTLVSDSRKRLIEMAKQRAEEEWLEEAKDAVEGDDPIPSVVWRDDPDSQKDEYAAYLFTAEEAAKFDKDQSARPEGALVVIRARKV